MSKVASRKSAALIRRAADADERLVTEALRHIQNLTRRAVIEGTAEVGDYLISTFYAGNLDLASSNSPAKPNALAGLLERADTIDTSAAFLRRAIRFSLQYRSLPASVRDQLSMRQQLALLPVDDARTKKKLAEEALARGFTSAQLTRRVREVGPDGASRRANRGRPPLPELDRATRAAVRLLESGAVDGALTPAALRALPEASRDAIRRAVIRLRERLERIGDALGRV